MVTGEQLRAARIGQGMTQAEVAARTGLARSTVANLEAGRHAITGRSLDALVAAFPVLSDDGPPRPPGFVSGGPYEILDFSLVYIFGHSRSPGEVIETRTVRALASGADRYGLSIDKSSGPGFRVEQEALFGGEIVHRSVTDSGGTSWNSCTLQFDRRLRRGETHTFAMRSFIDQDPEPDTVVSVCFTIPVHHVLIELRFTGPDEPVLVRRFGPLESCDSDVHWDAATPIAGGGVGRWIMRQVKPESHRSYGLTWQW